MPFLEIISSGLTGNGPPRDANARRDQSVHCSIVRLPRRESLFFVVLRREGGDPPSPRLRRGWKTDRLSWGKGVNDFFETRIAAQRIPHRIQAQVAIAWTAWDSGDHLKVLKRQLTFARPCTGHYKVPFHRCLNY